MYYGEVVYVSHRKEVLILSVESGYDLIFYPCHYTSTISNINKGSKVLFQGDWVNQKFLLKYIRLEDFDECEKCLRPLVGKRCNYYHKPLKRMLTGVWKIVHKRQDDKYSRLFLEQNHFTFAITAVPGSVYYSLFKKLKVFEYVRIRGWLGDKAVLKFMRKCIRVLKYPKQLPKDSLRNSCSARYRIGDRSSDMLGCIKEELT